MKLGFTGTRYGMSEGQKRAFRLGIESLSVLYEFHHGSCRGADVEAARIVRELRPKCLIVAHPGPDGDPFRDLSGVDDVTLPPKTHFARNRDIVNETDMLAATPITDERQSRGGTWYTIDYAKKAGKGVCIFRREPDLESGFLVGATQ